MGVSLDQADGRYGHIDQFDSDERHDNAAHAINQEIAAQLNPYFTEYVKVPVVGVTASYRF